MVVGVALGAYGTRIAAAIALHLPLELAALSLAKLFLAGRRRQTTRAAGSLPLRSGRICRCLSASRIAAASSLSLIAPRLGTELAGCLLAGRTLSGICAAAGGMMSLGSL